jgi:protein involved in polysaccharide export with SLBB domain
MRVESRYLIFFSCCLAALIGLSGPVPSQVRLPPAPNTSESEPQSPQIVIPPGPPDSYRSNYLLGIGDRLRVIVYGEADLSGEFEIDANGAISLPLVGSMQASGQTIDGLEQYITKRYNEYLRNPRVNLQVIQYRPFFIFGEVRQPGSYPFIPGMTVKNAIALAGGYTVRGGPSTISLEHASEKGKERDVTEDTSVYPGDAIRVSGRLF